MLFFQNLFSNLFTSSTSSIPADTTDTHFHGGVNIDGTPMLDSTIDINGDPYGCPSSLCDTDDDMFMSSDNEWMNSDDLFNDDDW
jgi:hypothetical protein